ncbi:hypothetical protein FMM05_13250 [Flavobacterium zepuense]|uniref:Uncharacterized protein n=1 Tax=Flavobacterium zepuense TaxID=2593302 RepID=A0A552UZK3_9FLAO|nr:hypothetical protein [Flavobacterium zepuense]TRW23622.1 hypothetical protein FMM05_13250 [Flavobacterium zepuense]
MTIKRVIVLGLLAFFSATTTIGLYLLSKDLIQTEGTFIRSFPPHPAEFDKQLDIHYNSYYFAGYDKGILYLGNYTAPLVVTAIDTSLIYSQEYRIQPESSNFTFKSLQLRVNPPYFYLSDGTVPCIYGGKINNWKAGLLMSDLAYFTLLEPVDSTRFVLRSNKSNTGENILGTFDLRKEDKLKLAENLLEKQSDGDGIFDTDGTLLYSKATSKIIYVYHYRNQFVVADKQAKLLYRGHTIDTTTKAQIKVAHIEKGNQLKMYAPPLTVNAHTAICEDLLFIHSTLRGKYDNIKHWSNASTIDVYNVTSGDYVMSFYIPKLKDASLRNFIVTPTQIFVLIENQLMSYTISNTLQKELLKAKRNTALNQ